MSFDALGPGAERFVEVGDRVILGLGGTGGGYWCGACEYCLEGDPRHCAQRKGIMGTFSEYFNVYAPSLVKLPDSVGDNEAPLACGGLTAYGAVKKLLKHQVLPGRPIAVIGAAGGLGHYAVQIATAFGYKVVGVDIGEDRLEFVRSLGAHLAVGADEAVEVVQRELGGVDASLVFSAKMAGFDLGMKLLRRNGLFVAVGLPATSEGNIELNPFEFFMKDPTIIYSARRHRAGHARARRPGRCRPRQEPCLAHRRAFGSRCDLRRTADQPVSRPRRHQRSDPLGVSRRARRRRRAMSYP